MGTKKKPVKAWAVHDSIGRPYLESIRRTRWLAIRAYVEPRKYVWEVCVIQDRASVRKVLVQGVK